MTIAEKMKKKCNDAGFYITPNLEKIARAKMMMFGDTEWERCPCDGNNPERSCISERCASEIKKNGICHCNCYQREP